MSAPLAALPAASIKKRARPSALSPEALVDKYLTDIAAAWVDSPRNIGSTWYSGDPVTLDCKVFDNTSLPAGVTVAAVGRYQYNLGKVDGKRYRPIAYRVPFLLDEHFYDDDFSVSHLCHNPACCNPAHHVLETLPVNKSRNGCPGGDHCHHRVRCLIPGPYHDK